MGTQKMLRVRTWTYYEIEEEKNGISQRQYKLFKNEKSANDYLFYLGNIGLGGIVREVKVYYISLKYEDFKINNNKIIYNGIMPIFTSKKEANDKFKILRLENEVKKLKEMIQNPQ